MVIFATLRLLVYKSVFLTLSLESMTEIFVLFFYRHGNNVFWFRRHKFRVFRVPQLVYAIMAIYLSMRQAKYALSLKFSCSLSFDSGRSL